MIGPETIIISAAKFIGNHLLKWGYQKATENKNDEYTQALYDIISAATTEYGKKYPIAETEKTPFYKSEVLLLEFLKVRFNQKLDQKKVKQAIESDKRILPPTSEELNTFFEYFNREVENSPNIKALDIEVNYKEEIFRISNYLKNFRNELMETIDLLKKDIALTHVSVQLIDEWNKQLDESAENLNEFKAITALERLEKLEGRIKSQNIINDSLFAKLYSLQVDALGLLQGKDGSGEKQGKLNIVMCKIVPMNKILIVLICVLTWNNLFSQTVVIKGRIRNWPNKQIMIKIPSEKTSFSVLSNDKGEYSLNFTIYSPFEGWVVIDKDSTNFFGDGQDTLLINGTYNKRSKEFIFEHNPKNESIESDVKIIDGKTVDSFLAIPSLLENKVTLIEIWATWCGPCIAQQKIIEKYKPIYESKGVDFFYISMDEEQNSSKWRRFIDYTGLKGMHLLANTKLWNDIVVTRKDASIPVYYIVDKNKEMHLFKATEIKGVKDMIKVFKLKIDELFSTIDGYVK